MPNNGQDFLPIRSVETPQWPCSMGSFMDEKTKFPRCQLLPVKKRDENLKDNFCHSRTYTLRLFW